MSGVVVSGARVTRVLPRLSELSRATALSSRVRNLLASWMPLRLALRNGPSMCTPSTPGTPAAMACSVARMAASTTARSTLIRVGRKPVVP